VVRVGPREPEVLDLCTKTLRDRDAERSKVAVETLAAAGPERALPGLLLALEDPDAAISGAAEKSLRQGPVRKEQVKELVAALDNKKESIRLLLIDVLAKLGPDAAEAVPALVALLKGPDGAVRKRALKAIGELGPTAKEAGPAVVALMRDADVSARFDLIDVLQKIDAPELAQSIPFLVSALKIEKPMDEEQQALRKKAHDALVKIGKPAVPALTKALDSDFSGGGFSPAGMLNAEARLAVVQTLEAIGPAARNAETLRLLARLAGNDPYPAIRTAADQARKKLQEK
jgi:HEAT repeat protein